MILAAQDERITPIRFVLSRGMTSRMNRFCSHHCRGCGGHFTSLAAFDAHKPQRNGACEYPDEPELTEFTGTCRVSDPEQTVKRVTLYEHPKAAQARQAFAGRQTASR